MKEVKLYQNQKVISQLKRMSMENQQFQMEGTSYCLEYFFVKIKFLYVSLCALLTRLTLASGASLLQPTPTLMYVLCQSKESFFLCVFGLT